MGSGPASWGEIDFSIPDDSVVCSDCIFREEDVVFSDGMISGAKKGICKKYPSLSNPKPYDVLWEKGECEHYCPQQEMQ